MTPKTFNEALDDLCDALDRLWQSIFDALTVRVWHERIALWQLLLAFDGFLIIVVGISQLLKGL